MTRRTWPPATPNQGENDPENLAKRIVDGVCGGWSAAQCRSEWERQVGSGERRRTIGAEISRHAFSPLRADSPGSHNHKPVSLWAYLLALSCMRETISDVEWREVTDYADGQLTPVAEGGVGLAGIETLSRRYLLTTLSPAEHVVPFAPVPVARRLRDLLTAHAVVLALAARKVGRTEVVTVHGGERSKAATTTDDNAELSTWLSGLLYGQQWPPPGMRQQWAVGLRCAASSPQWMDDDLAEMLREYIASGKHSGDLVNFLDGLGASTQVPVYVERRLGDPGSGVGAGVCAWLGRSQNGNSGPCMGGSIIDGKQSQSIHALYLHPGKADSGDGRKLGRRRAWRVGDRIVAEAEGVAGFERWPPLPGTRVDGDTITGSIPTPTGALLHPRIEIGPAGVRFVGEPPRPEPTPDPTPEDPMPPSPTPSPSPRRVGIDELARLLDAAATHPVRADAIEAALAGRESLELALKWPIEDDRQRELFAARLAAITGER